MARLAQSCLQVLTHGHGHCSVLKTVTYALMHLCVAMLVAFALTGDWRAALAIGLVEPFIQTFAYSLHERAWGRRSKAHMQTGCI
ncbi:DUF2061 domain-containing protein [Maricaulis parjimensis]|uniref:DUF2061 domain-containing protein n=1 Tax=Maricaulis parjimensis TaxID=144023 RepID=UPI0019393F5F|nr:DUF2061 domain-containing protein [Maricaulis parjimensis]